MQIHLSDVTDSEGKHIQLQPELELDKISFQMVSLVYLAGEEMPRHP